MQPIDYRNATWADVRGRVTRLRQAVYEALLAHGPCTTRELAHAAGLDLLTVRPRVTELIDLGWAELADEDAPGHEGIYRALSESDARQLFACRRAEAIGTRVQTELSLSI